MEREIISEERILAFFKTLHVTKSRIKLVIDLNEYSASVIRVSKLNIELEFKYDLEVEELKEADLTFKVNEVLYHCETDIIEVVSGRSIILSFPLTVLKWLKGKHKRIELNENDLAINFKLINTGKQINISPAIPFRLRQLYKLLYDDNESVDIKNIFANITVELKSHSNKGKL
ncbi:MAG: hypothetical protein KAS39_08575, partial [Actinomycetia bacterium]|nr:hypothetical protein [Actinomycetes bacterium]